MKIGNALMAVEVGAGITAFGGSILAGAMVLLGGATAISVLKKKFKEDGIEEKLGVSTDHDEFGEE